MKRGKLWGRFYLGFLIIHNGLSFSCVTFCFTIMSFLEIPAFGKNAVFYTIGFGSSGMGYFQRFVELNFNSRFPHPNNRITRY